jgi:mannose-1-phosphate guanylyltransferase / mannose-6-phosphate isomerase
MLLPVVLSGGAGTRLWPVSREAHPKPFMRLSDGHSLLQKTLQRAAALPGVERVLTITNREHYFKTRDDYTALPAVEGLSFDYVLEPCGRNTAPAIAVAALRAVESAGPDAVLLVLPADHLIADQDAFARGVARAEALARGGSLITFGIPPAYAETGYGYIERGEPLGRPAAANDPPDGNLAPVVAMGGEVPAYRVRRFVEKPDREHAETYVASGRHYWNSGMFCFQAGAFLEALREHAPALHEGVVSCWEAARRDVEPVELDLARFRKLPDISVDYAVMEPAREVIVVAGEFDWSDIGSWAAVSDLQAPDAAGNRVTGESVLVNSRNCYVQTEDRLIAAVGVEDLLIIDTPDALLVAHKDHAQEVKQVVQQLRSQDHECYRLHRTVARPWGSYTVLEEGDRFKIKRIVVKPGASLSLQMHHHRSEHWVVVSGTAKVVNGEKEWLVRTNESTYIPIGIPHRLMNPGVISLVMIEVQSGDYLGEDDIVRFDDQYGRA